MKGCAHVTRKQEHDWDHLFIHTRKNKNFLLFLLIFAFSTCGSLEPLHPGSVTCPFFEDLSLVM